jgi:long-chain acyl-CoA synthetase
MSDVFGKHQPKIPYQPIADLLAQYRARDPDKLAIVDLDQGTSISFGALEAAVTDIAAALRQKGVGKGLRVLLLSDETLEKLLIWLACWRLGAVVAPLNIELNAGLIADLATSVGPVLTLVHKELDGHALIAGKPFIRFGRYSASAADADPQDDFFRGMPRGIDPKSLPERNDAADIACIFCTSGTTARPKIVVYDHCAYWLNGLSTLECLGLTEDDRTLEYRSFGWNSAQVLSLMPFLEKGLTMHIARHFSHSRFFEWIARHGITFAAGVPTVLNMLLNKPLGYTAKDVPTLRLMTCSTAPLTREQWLRFEEMYGVKLLQMYGMSEAGWMCGNRHYSSKMGTVGLPALHQELEVVDGEGRPCPPNVEGEVTAGGRLHQRHRPHQGPHHPRRREHCPARDRRGPARSPGRARRCRGRRAGRDLRRGGRLLRRAEAGREVNRSGGARSLPVAPCSCEDAEAGRRCRGAAEKRPRQGPA